jgi:hypothetical protein
MGFAGAQPILRLLERCRRDVGWVERLRETHHLLSNGAGNFEMDNDSFAGRDGFRWRSTHPTLAKLLFVRRFSSSVSFKNSHCLTYN